jgi:branched-subunit amino acid ABC-type transport system permease component
VLSNFQDQFASLTVGGLSLGFIYVMIALGYTMVYGVLRMINFANSEIFMYGTFASILIVRDVFGFTQQSEPATGARLVWILSSVCWARCSCPEFFRFCSNSLLIADCETKAPIN